MKTNFLIAKLSLVFVMLFVSLTQSINIYANKSIQVNNDHAKSIDTIEPWDADVVEFYKDKKIHSGHDPDEVIWKTVINKENVEFKEPTIEVDLSADYLVHTIKVYKISNDNKLELIKKVSGEEIVEIDGSINYPLFIKVESCINFENLYAEENEFTVKVQFTFSLEFYDGLNLDDSNYLIKKYDAEDSKLFTNHLTLDQIDASNSESYFKIRYNYDCNKLDEAIVYLEYDDNFKLDQNSLKITKGMGQVVDKSKYSALIEDNNMVSIKFDDGLTEGVDIVFKRKIDENSNLNAQVIVSTNLNSNHIIRDIEVIPPEQKNIYGFVSDIDYADKIIVKDLIIDLKRNITNLKISNNHVSKGITLDKLAIRIYDLTNNEQLSEAEYNINLDGDVFNITFTDGGVVSSSRLKVSLSYLYDQPEKIQFAKYVIANKVAGYYESENIFEQLVSVEVEQLRGIVFDNGLVFAKFDKHTNIIAWEILANYNRLESSIVEVKSNFVGENLDDVIISKYSVNKDGSLHFVNNLDKSEYEVKFLDDNTICFLMNNDSASVYKVTYKSMLEGSIVKEDYPVIINIKAANFIKEIKYTLQINHGGHHLSAHGQQTDCLMLWETLINPRKSHIENMELKSSISSGKILYEDLKIFPVKLNSLGIWVKDIANPLIHNVDYRIDIIEDKTLSVKFLNDVINNSYVLKYYSEPLLDSESETIMHHITILGRAKNDTHFFDSDKTFAKFVKPNKSDEMYPSVNYLTIKNKNEKNIKLAGGVFDLQVIKGSLTETIKKDLAVTNEKVIDNLPAGDYRLIQKASPAGYLLNVKPLEFTIDTDKNGKIMDKKVVFLNKQASIVFFNKNASNLPLVESEFVISSDDQQFVAYSVKSDELGLVIFNDLAPGNYQIKQLKVGDDYILNSQHLIIRVDALAYGKKKPIILDDFINYQKEVEIINKSKNTNIFGGVFNLYDTNNKLVNTITLEKDTKIISGLKPGAYTIINSRAATNYLINKKVYGFKVETKSLNKPELLKVVIESEKHFKNNQDIVNTGLSFNKIYYWLVLSSLLLIMTLKNRL